MGTSLIYNKRIENAYLGQVKIIRGRTQQDLDARVQTQLAAWAKREALQREKDAAREAQEQSKAEAKRLSRAAQDEIDELRSLLETSLATAGPLDWEGLMDRRKCSRFSFAEPEPVYSYDRQPRLLAQVRHDMRVPTPSPILETLFPGLRRRREKGEREALAVKKRETTQIKEEEKTARVVQKQALEQWETRKERARNAHRKANDDFRQKQAVYNDWGVQFRQRFEQGDQDAIEEYLRRVLSRDEYPSCLPTDFEVAFDPHAATVVVDWSLPLPDHLSRVVEYRYVASRKRVEPVEMKAKDAVELYELANHQVIFTVLNRVFSACYTEHVEGAVFNGWASGVEKKTGHDFTSCIVSCQVSREEFENLNIARIDPQECLRGLSALSAGPLVELAPVKPIMEINRDDDRFAESRDVLDAVEIHGQNLATMDWEDFEHLVRELFGKLFSAEGCEVKITRASRDRGVDAIAFDPDPLRGGKYVIQAKRYNNVVGVDAVRDLYGTVINEGATKGILVTTSHFGRDSREFAANKPLTLIDGSNLVHMLQEQGYKVHIELQTQS